MTTNSHDLHCAPRCFVRDLLASSLETAELTTQGFKDVGTWEAVKVAAATAPTAPTTTSSHAPRYP